jgi:antirestriction protein ArdC
MSRTRLSAEERAERLNTAHERLVNAVSALHTSDDWMAYMATMAKFHRYSANNCFLIALQRGDATHVAGFQTWKALGRSVNKGAKGIAILAPCTYKTTLTDKDNPDAPTITRTAIRGFRVTYVFDVLTTTGADLPQPVGRPELLTGEAPASMWEAISEQVTALGFTVELVGEIAGSPGANGTTDPLTKTVQIATQSRDRASQLKTLIHELAHCHLHTNLTAYRADRGRCEVEAESVAFLVCDAFGLDSQSYTVGYVATWAADTDTVLAVANTVRKCATQIIDKALPADIEPAECEAA